MAKKVRKNDLFGYIDNVFINLYSEENPILFKGNKCFFLFTNINDIHRPLIGYGEIIQDVYVDGMNKLYYVELEEINETQKIQTKYIHSNKTVMLHQYKDEFVTQSSKVHFLTHEHTKEFFAANLFRVESFFIRPTIQEIKKLRVEYLSVIKYDLNNQIEEINEILTEDG